jgi:hypothetical protein
MPTDKKSEGQPGAKPAAKRPARARRPIEEISDEDLSLRIAMREAGALDEDTDPARLPGEEDDDW